VHAVDFAEGMLARAREINLGRPNLSFLKTDLTDLKTLHGQIDVAVAVNSLILPDVGNLEKALAEIYRCLRPGGVFMGILPAMDAVHYHNMLLLDRALEAGKPLLAARKNAAHFGDFDAFDFGFGLFRFEGLEQHFWQPFEIRHRLSKAGFHLGHLKKVRLSWRQFSCGQELKKYPPPWDWFFQAQAK
jgi:SAM-dependent methyltransferase